MNRQTGQHDQEHLDQVHLYAIQALSPAEISAVEAQLAECEDCRSELEALRPIVRSFADWPMDVLRPATSLWERLAGRIAEETGARPLIAPPTPPNPEWDEAAPGIFVKVLSSDTEKNYVSMLVRLAPGTDYPPHRHGGVEELHLLDGVLKVDDKTLYPGDFIHAEAGSMDHRVWSETGCTCVLMTSGRDELL
jgi:anti-sigma factor ChrR (cupin superfamily)